MKKLLGLLAVAPLALAACGGSTDEGFTGDINVYSRDTTSGTREGFFSAIGAGDAKEDNAYLTTGTSITSGNGDTIAKIKNDDKGIGYIALTSLEDSGLKGLDFNGVEATDANVADDSYKMSRTFGMVTIDDTADTAEAKLIAEFNKFVWSTNGEAALVSAGVIPLAGAHTGAYTADATVCDGTAMDINIGGSTSVESAATALTSALADLCAAFDPIHGHTGSSASENVGKADSDMLIGFSSSGQRSGWQTGTIKEDLGIDAIVAVVNKANPLDNITTAQLQEIFVKHDATHEGAAVAPNTKNTTKWDDLV